MIGFNLFNRRIVLYCRKVERVAGLNSTLKDGLHIGMVDIDRDSVENLLNETEHVMSKYRVGRADIMSTGKPGGYHVYLWGRLTFQESLRAMLEFTRVAVYIHHADMLAVFQGAVESRDPFDLAAIRHDPAVEYVESNQS